MTFQDTKYQDLFFFFGQVYYSKIFILFEYNKHYIVNCYKWSIDLHMAQINNFSHL